MRPPRIATSISFICTTHRASQPLLTQEVLPPAQDVGLVPIIEPDVSMAGTHTLEAAVAINTKIQSTLYKACLDHGVFMEGTILKSNIVRTACCCAIFAILLPVTCYLFYLWPCLVVAWARMGT